MLKEVYSAGIIGVGAYIPEEVRKNDFWNVKELMNLPSESKNPFKGIDERRVFAQEMLPSDAEVLAGRIAIEDAKLSPEDIDLVILHSMLQDEHTPGNASLVQHKLGLKNAGAWNMDSCCSSFVTMVVNASNLIATGEFKNILIITSVMHSKIVDYSDYLSIYVGDAAGAAVIGRVPENRGYIASYCNSNGYYHDAFTLTERLPYGMTLRKHFGTSLSKLVLTTNPEKTRELGKESLSNMKEVLEKTLKKSKIQSNQINMFLSHQPCYWAHDAWRQAVNIPEGNSYTTFQKYGNLASSSIPINLYEAKKQGRLKDGDNLLIASSGAGENHIAAVLKWAYEK